MKKEVTKEDNGFVWTEELAIQFAISLRNGKEKNHQEHKSWRDSLDEFKKNVVQKQVSEKDEEVYNAIEYAKNILVKNQLFHYAGQLRDWQKNLPKPTPSPSINTDKVEQPHPTPVQVESNIKTFSDGYEMGYKTALRYSITPDYLLEKEREVFNSARAKHMRKVNSDQPIYDIKYNTFEDYKNQKLNQ